MPKYIILAIIIALTSCVEKNRDYAMEISIQDASNYDYNLKHGILIVHNITKPDTSIKFVLSEKELKGIIDKYYELNLDLITGKLVFKDNCKVIPKFYTTLLVHSRGYSQEITIDDGCKDFDKIISPDANRIIAFLDFVNLILDNKPEIKNGRNSDIIAL